MKLRVLDVNEVNSYIKRILTNDPILYNLNIRGEISNFKIHSSKNVYFSLKDEFSKINCVVFKNNFDNNLKLEDGTKVIVRGYISVYDRDGSYQLYVDKIEVEGMGNLHIEFNKLKEKLKKEGLFDVKYKMKIPQVPKNIGVITSETGAAIRDIINVIKRRYPKVNIKIYPVLVQGTKSAPDICRAIDFFDKNKNVDTIILGRGGGSIEELWSFNEEIVARAIFNCKIPIISAVGHETDFTIADFVSDMRAPTPSAAAEIATPSIKDINYKLSNIKDRMDNNIYSKIQINKNRLDNINENINKRIKDYIIKDKIIQLDQIYDKINIEVLDKIKTENKNLSSMSLLLHNLSPLSTMDRGYCIANKDENVIKSVFDVNKDDKINIILKDGTINCEVENIIIKEV